jgi:hypothetical protein
LTPSLPTSDICFFFLGFLNFLKPGVYLFICILRGALSPSCSRLASILASSNALTQPPRWLEHWADPAMPGSFFLPYCFDVWKSSVIWKTCYLDIFLKELVAHFCQLCNQSICFGWEKNLKKEMAKNPTFWWHCARLLSLSQQSFGWMCGVSG